MIIELNRLFSLPSVWIAMTIYFVIAVEVHIPQKEERGEFSLCQLSHASLQYLNFFK